MASASPTPLGLRQDGLPRRGFPRRPEFRRGSPLSIVSTVNDRQIASGQDSLAEDSEDEGSAPVLSAEAQEILAVKTLETYKDAAILNGAALYSAAKESLRRSTPISQPHSLGRRTSSPSLARSSSPRIVRLSANYENSGGSTTLKRAVSTFRLKDGPQSSNGARLQLVNTPDQQLNKAGAGVSESLSGSAADNLNPTRNDKQPSAGAVIAPQGGDGLVLTDLTQESPVPVGSLTNGKIKGEESGVYGSLKVRRVGKVTGRYLSGPARRGMLRRHSEEDKSPPQDSEVPVAELPQTFPTVQDEQPLKQYPQLDLAERVRPPEEVSGVKLAPGIKPLQPKLAHTLGVSSESAERYPQPAFKVPPLPILPSRYDQENEPPPTFKRNKSNGLDLLDSYQKPLVLADSQQPSKVTKMLSPPRQPLGPRSQNTPLRPAPRPPQMSILDTATANAGGASTAQSKKKRSFLAIKGKAFTRLDCIGRGGSAKVYRVMAENYKVFALKRVSTEDVDELTLRGFKGEIDLLEKLKDVDRVVRLFDWELSNERHTLSILMEFGESDLNKVLSFRYNAENAQFDISFTRYFWKEMVECVQAVHGHDIVHSDLKPANFLLVQGRLKLIDFGIANAIQDDTVNVHREQTIGTPNYMSPEALIDSNSSNGFHSGAGKLMKLGKPSDIWSLGCILYQMVYGKPPFAHITNQMQRVMAIPNAECVIQYNDVAVGSVPVPTGLLRTMKRCLNRDPTQRPTAEQLLAPTDAFLNPDYHIKDTVPVGKDVLLRVQQNIIRHIRDKGLPSDAEMSTWPARFYDSIKQAVEEGRA